MKCNNCTHLIRCKLLLQVTGEETDCDWTPSKFMQATSEEG